MLVFVGTHGAGKLIKTYHRRRRWPAENLVKPSVFTLANSTACRVKVSTYRRIAHPVLRENLRKPTFYEAVYEVGYEAEFVISYQQAAVHKRCLMRGRNPCSAASRMATATIPEIQFNAYTRN